MNARIAMWVQYAGMAISMAGGAPWPRPNWVLVAAGLAVVGVGIVLKRAADKRDPRMALHAEGNQVREGSIPAAIAALPGMVQRVRALAASTETRPLGEIAAEIDGIQASGTEQVAAAQEALVRAYSFAGYATVMTPLASGERWLYRAWSAASDGHRPEAMRSIETALPFLEEAQSALDGLVGAAGPSPATPSA